MREYILPALKLLGLLLTAFFGIAALFREKGESPEHERRNRRWGTAAIFASLAVAASAELTDTIYKSQEATTAAKRAAEAAEQTQRIISDLERSLHPLFPIKFHTVFSAELRHPTLATFRDRLIKAIPADRADEESSWPELAPDTPLFPNPNREPAAYALLTADPQMAIFLTRKPANPQEPFEREEPDLSFSLKLTFPPPPTLEGEKKISPKANSRRYGYSKSGIITMYFPSETISASDCYSNGQIISPSDLLGARMTIWISPFFVLDFLDITLPGNREIQLHQKDLERVQNRDKNLFIFTFPKTKEEMSKLFIP